MLHADVRGLPVWMVDTLSHDSALPLQPPMDRRTYFKSRQQFHKVDFNHTTRMYYKRLPRPDILKIVKLGANFVMNTVDRSVFLTPG